MQLYDFCTKVTCTFPQSIVTIPVQVVPELQMIQEGLVVQQVHGNPEVQEVQLLQVHHLVQMDRGVLQSIREILRISSFILLSHKKVEIQ